MGMRLVCAAVLGAALMAAAPAQAAEVKLDETTTTINRVDANGVGEKIGTITFKDSMKGGVDIMVELMEGSLAPGEHGMHVHTNPACGPDGADGKKGPGLAAGGHYDPEKAEKHAGPMGSGHKGDLPFVTANEKGAVKARLRAKNLEVSDLAGRSVIIHEGHDNYSDSPDPLGGGGARVACGVIGK